MQTNHSEPTNHSIDVSNTPVEPSAKYTDSDLHIPEINDTNKLPDNDINPINPVETATRKKSDTSHITAAKRVSNNTKKSKKPPKKPGKVETILTDFFSKIFFFIHKIIHVVSIWIDDFIDEYFDEKHYFTYLMCYAAFLIVALFSLIFKPFE